MPVAGVGRKLVCRVYDYRVPDDGISFVYKGVAEASKGGEPAATWRAMTKGSLGLLERLRQKAGVRTRILSLRDRVLARFRICLKRPSFIDIEITDRCSLRCITCLKWTVRDAKAELTEPQWKAAIAALREWLGPFTLNIGGGEPFLRNDLLSIIRYARGSNISVSVVSNGYNIDRDLADAIIDSGLDAISISLNGITPETHDLTRGVEGSFARAMEALHLLNERRGKLRLGVATIITNSNRQEIPRLVELVKEEGLDGIVFQALSERSIFHPFTKDTAQFNERWHERAPLWERGGAKTAALIDDLIAMKAKGERIDNSIEQLRWMREYVIDPVRVLPVECRVGVSNFTVDPYGEVRLCFNFGTIGNILRSTPQVIWNSGNARRQRRLIASCPHPCRLMNCNFGR